MKRENTSEEYIAKVLWGTQTWVGCEEMKWAVW